MRRKSRLAAGILVMCLVFTVTLLLILLAIRAEARRHQCYTYMANIGLVVQMYAMDSEGGLFPELSAKPGQLFWSNRAACNPSPVFPKYLNDLYFLICPSRRTENLVIWSELCDIRLMDDHSYFYLGYTIQNQQDLEAFAHAYAVHTAKRRGFSGDLHVETSEGSVTLHRLRRHVARALLGIRATFADVRELEGRIPVLIERPGQHDTHGGNVLYFDGHVEFIPEGEWPYTVEAQVVLEGLDTCTAPPSGAPATAEVPSPRS